MKFHWFGINWHVFNQSECRNCCLYIIIQKIAPEAKSGKYFQIWFFPRFRGKKWRRSEHAHASYPGLFFRTPGFSPYMGREERRVQGLDYTSSSSIIMESQPTALCMKWIVCPFLYLIFLDITLSWPSILLPSFTESLIFLRNIPLNTSVPNRPFATVGHVTCFSRTHWLIIGNA